MPKSKTTPTSVCSFCHVPIDEQHTTGPCPHCPGTVHYLGQQGECTCCGRKSQLPAPPVEQSFE
jgi:hypothetical protein